MAEQGPKPQRRTTAIATPQVDGPSTETRSIGLVDQLGNAEVGAVLQGATLGGLEAVVLEQVQQAGVFDRGTGTALDSNTEVQALLFGTDSALVSLADSALELQQQEQAKAPAPEQPETETAPEASSQPAPETASTETAAPEAPAARSGVGTDAWPLDLEGASEHTLGTVASVQMAELTGAEIGDDQLEDWARTILVQEGQARLAATRRTIEDEVVPRYEGEGAEQAVQQLRELGDHYDALLTGQASLYAKAVVLGVRQTSVSPEWDRDLFDALKAELVQVEADIDTLESARTLLLQGRPELARIVDGEPASETQSPWRVHDDTYTNRLSELDDAEALELVHGEIDGVLSSIDTTHEKLGDGDLDPLDLGTMSRQTLTRLEESYPRMSAGMKEQLEDHEFWEKAQDLGVAAVDVAVLAVAMAYTGGTGALLLEGAAAGLGLAAAGENLETALDMSDAANAHLDPEQALNGGQQGDSAFWAGVDLVLSGVGVTMAGKSMVDLASAGRLAGGGADAARYTPGLAPENFVVRRDGFGHDLASDPAARAFAEASSSSADLARRGLDSGELGSATDALNFLAERRAGVAQAGGEIGADSFGVVREPLAEGLAYQTPLSGRYADYQERAMQLPDGKVTGQLPDGSEVPMTSIGLPLRLLHTGGEHVPKILEHVDTLYADLMRTPDLPREEVVRRVGEMHWWLSHGMPYARGSAAVSGTFARTVMAQRGIDLGPTAQGVALDLDALVEPSVEAYAARYGSLHDGG